MFRPLITAARQLLNIKTAAEIYGKSSEVFVNEYKKGDFGSVLFTENIQYCSAVLLRHKSKEGFLFGHFEMTKSEEGQKSLQEMLESAEDHLSEYGLSLYMIPRLTTVADDLKALSEANSRRIIREFVEKGGDFMDTKIINGSSKIAVTNGDEIKEFSSLNPPFEVEIAKESEKER